MRASKNTPHVKNHPVEEPVYVDEEFPGDIIQEDPWARKPPHPEPASSEPLLSFDEEDENEEFEEDEQEEMDKSIPVTPPKKPAVSPRSYRMKIPPPREHRPPPRPAAPKSLPAELPLPIRRDQGIVPPHLRREREERTGTWPVEHDPKRTGLPQPKNGSPMPANRVQPPKEQPASSRPTPKEPLIKEPLPKESLPPRVPSPPRQTTNRPVMPPMPDIPPFPEPETVVVQEPRPAPRQQEPLPPPLFPTTPTPARPPTQVLPVEATPAPNAPSFRPLVAESQDEQLEETETGWDQVETARHHTVHDLIERLALPKNSLILGICDDGLPLVLELSDPSPGALLFLGDEVEGLQKHLQSVLASICLMSDPKQVQVDIITPTPKAFAGPKLYPHVQKVHLPDQDEMYELLGSLFGLIEQRQRKDNSLAGKILKEFLPANKALVRILMIDQVDVLVEQLAPESLAYLRWLLRRGPAANVWVLASLNTRNAQAIDGKTLKAFGLRISGKIQNAGQASRLTDVPAEKLSSLVSGEQACLKLDEEIVEFSILE